MPLFSYQARSRDGRPEQGQAEAPSGPVLVTQLRARGLLVLAVHALQQPKPHVTAVARRRFLSRRPRSIDIESGLQQLAFQLRSGITLVNALETCAAQAERPAAANLWRFVARLIGDGQPFSVALATTNSVPALVLPLAKVGEETGRLEQALERAASTLERRRELRSQLLTAMTYPIIVLVMAVGATIYMLTGVIPKLQALLSAHGRALPVITQALVDLSWFLRTYGWHLCIVSVTGVCVLAVLMHWPPARLIIDGLLLRLPVMGKVLRIAAAATVSRTLGALLSSGVRVTEALLVAEEAVANRRVRSLLSTARERVMQGAALAPSLAEGRILPPLMTGMIAVGEVAGTLDQVLDGLAKHHDERLAMAIRRMAALVEPAIIIVVGGVVGFVYMAFFAAIYGFIGGRS